MSPGLYVVATPIGNAADITLRALEALKGCDQILAEDTRVTAKLLAIYGIQKPLAAYNDHNAERERPKALSKLRQGARIALVSDAGTPLISDPGFKLVRAALDEGLPVRALPGASALLTALVAAGLPTDRFLFAGFLPAKQGERKATLAELKNLRASLVFFESAQRLVATLGDMNEALGPRQAAVARELTKFHEEVRRGPLADLQLQYARSGPPKGEVTIVIAPPIATAPDFARVDRALDAALAYMPHRAAVELVSDMLEAPRRAVYERALRRGPDRG
ncbi:MAG TPA: 16S rRNA (cytidine(1402)-2'-O)-methyltransferase [Rhizomicrobium sp.]|jgi:16S rRNA (cytidine1402-2'-O)-methyltransferase|nr:16S rRNA (cytidine(1402)-2'-O)-methyltransferase [Rhizomicrobium sp.]